VVTHPGQLLSAAEHGVGTVLDDGAHLVGSGTRPTEPGPFTVVNDVLENPDSVIPVKGPLGQSRLSYVSGSVQVITENGIVVTIITR
jgi:hypothetical protein